MAWLTLLTAFLFIAFEAVTEGLILKHSQAVSAILFRWWVQILTAGLLFAAWLLVSVTGDYSVVKLIVGFVLLRFAVFDAVFNISAGLNINYIGGRKLYDRILRWTATKSGIGGVWFARAIALIWALAWLLDYDGWRHNLNF